MFVRKKHYEQLVRDAASAPERERLVTYLIEQVEYLRLLVGRGTTATVPALSGPPELTWDTTSVEEKPWVGEEEEDLLAMRQAEVISQQEFDDALGRIRQRDHIIE